MLLLLLLLILVVQCMVSKQKMPKKPGKTRKYLGFSGYFRVLHWTLEIVVGHCQAFLIVVQPA